MKNLCAVCKNIQEIVYVEEGTDRPFCQACLAREPLTPDEWKFLLLMLPGSPFGPPFTEGDVVEARTAGVIYDGVGTVHEMDMVLAHGGTPVYPTWRVVLSTKAHDKAPDEDWYTENCLTRINQEAEL